jgi:DNA replication protein DnaC
MYKTYLTSNGVLIESPHDYQAVNISSRYTTNYSDNFQNKIVEILDKRLKIAGITNAPHEFFPLYEEQEKRIEEEREKIRIDFRAGNGRSSRENDDVRRYAVPNYIRSLGGKSKSRNTFRYAGLESIIHLSSGIIRYSLDAASNMFDEVSGDNPASSQVTSIPTEIQNAVMRKISDEFLYIELRKPGTEQINDEAIYPIASPKSDIEKLQNLICAMGSTFFEILVSNRAERKVFSIALSNIPDDEIRRVLKIGVRLNYLYETTIGNKEGNGRTWLYIMNRRLAPSFILDPSGFQGYLFITNDDLHNAFANGKQLRRVSDDDCDINQLSLFDIWED